MTRRPTLERRLKRQEWRLQFEQELLARRADEIGDDCAEEIAPEEADAPTDTESQASAPLEANAVAPAATVSPPEEPPAPVASTPEPEAETPAPEPGMPTERSPQQAYAEENCRWRQRGPEDYDWDDDERPRLNECLHEYDPLESE